MESKVPNLAEMGLHHSLFRLTDSDVETLGFTITSGQGWL